MGAVSLQIFGQEKYIKQDEVPQFSHETMLLLEDKEIAGGAVNLRRRVSDLTHIIQNVEEAKRNSAKAKVISLLLLAGSIAILATHFIVAVIFYPVSPLLAVSFTLLGTLSTRMCNDFNRVLVGRMLGTTIERDKGTFSYFPSFIRPVYAAFTYVDTREEKIRKQRGDLQQLFEKTITHYRTNFNEEKAKLEHVCREDDQEFTSWADKVKKGTPFADTAKILLIETMREQQRHGSALRMRSSISSDALNEFQAMNRYLCGVVGTV